jgi:hypothetical protein
LSDSRLEDNGRNSSVTHEAIEGRDVSSKQLTPTLKLVINTCRQMLEYLM